MSKPNPVKLANDSQQGELERVKNCSAKIQEALKEYNCHLSPFVTMQGVPHKGGLATNVNCGINIVVNKKSLNLFKPA